MNIAEFEAAHAADLQMIAEGKTPVGMDPCAECRKPLQTFVTGRESLGDGSQVCSDCYWEMMGDHLDANPISALMTSRHFNEVSRSAEE